MIVVDPFAGTGRIHELSHVPGVRIVEVEIEPEWARLSSGTVVADALRLPLEGKDRDRVAAAIDAVVWHAPSDQGPLSPVLMLQEVVRELRLPKVSALAWGGGEANMLEYPDGPVTATYTVLGVEANYADGRMCLYVLDTGVAAVPLASDFPVPAPASAADREEPAIGRFRLGTIVATSGAVERMERQGVDARRLLARHGAGDWGDIAPEDVGVNEEALRGGGRLLSAYGSKTEGDDATIWIITEADRSATTILRPEDY